MLIPWLTEEFKCISQNCNSEVCMSQGPSIPLLHSMQKKSQKLLDHANSLAYALLKNLIALLNIAMVKFT